MEQFHKKIKEYIQTKGLKAEHLVLNKSCHTVEDAAKAISGTVDNIIKNICMIDNNNQLIVAIVKGEDRASTSRVGKALEIERPRLANEKEVLHKTGYPAGGVPSFGFDATFVIDPLVIEREYVYTGGGSPYSLIKISTKDLLNVNNGLVARARK